MLPAAVALLALAVLAAGCGGTQAGPAADSAPTATSPPATTSTEPPVTATTAPTTTTEPLPGATTTPVEASAGGSETALLERVAVGAHDGYDRIVFQFRNTLPGYRVEYVVPPLRQDGSGDVVQVKGDAFLTVRMEPASGFDTSTGNGTMVYTGPARIDGAAAGAANVREVARVGDFEAVLTWAVGLASEQPFQVSKLDAPPRLVVDVRTP